MESKGREVKKGEGFPFSCRGTNHFFLIAIHYTKGHGTRERVATRSLRNGGTVTGLKFFGERVGLLGNA